MLKHSSTKMFFANEPANATSTAAATTLSGGVFHRITNNFLGRARHFMFRVSGGRHADELLEAEMLRLSELSPHLLLDVGIDPITGELIEQAELQPRAVAPVRALAAAPVEPLFWTTPKAHVAQSLHSDAAA